MVKVNAAEKVNSVKSTLPCCVGVGRYVDVSTVDVATAQSIAKAVRGTGATYLEVRTLSVAG